MSSWGNLQDLTRLFLSGGAQTSVFDQLLDAVDTWMIRFDPRRGGHIQRGPDMFILTVLRFEHRFLGRVIWSVARIHWF